MYRKYHNHLIDYSTYAIYEDILKNNEYINEIVAWGKWNKNYDITFEPHTAILTAPWANGDVHLRSLYAKICNVDEGNVIIHPEKYEIPFKHYIALHNTSIRQKSYQKFNELIKYLNIPTVQIGGRGDLPIENISLDIRGKTTFRQTAYILKNAKFLLGIDSFPAHCASAVGIPSIILFGQTSARLCKPQFNSIVIEPDYINTCTALAPCHNSSKVCNPYCIDVISSEQILEVIEKEFKEVLK